MTQWPEKQLLSQCAAQEQARLTRKPVDDGYGTRWYPPGADGIPICGFTPSSGDPRMKLTLADMHKLHEYPKVLPPMVKEGANL